MLASLSERESAWSHIIAACAANDVHRRPEDIPPPFAREFQYPPREFRTGRVNAIVVCALNVLLTFLELFPFYRCRYMTRRAGGAMYHGWWKSIERHLGGLDEMYKIRLKSFQIELHKATSNIESLDKRVAIGYKILQTEAWQKAQEMFRKDLEATKNDCDRLYELILQ